MFFSASFWKTILDPFCLSDYSVDVVAVRWFVKLGGQRCPGFCFSIAGQNPLSGLHQFFSFAWVVFV